MTSKYAQIVASEAFRAALGTQSDADVARRFGVSHYIANRERVRAGIPLYSSLLDPWWDSAGLGTQPDAVIAAKIGKSKATVQDARKIRGILPYRFGVGAPPPRSRFRRYATRKMRRLVIARDGMNCGICGGGIDSERDVEIDHIVPFTKGGMTAIENLRVTHFLCNRRKQNHYDQA